MKCYNNIAFNNKCYNQNKKKILILYISKLLLMRYFRFEFWIETMNDRN